jgi:hypothetical protein
MLTLTMDVLLRAEQSLEWLGMATFVARLILTNCY